MVGVGLTRIFVDYYTKHSRISLIVILRGVWYVIINARLAECEIIKEINYFVRSLINDISIILPHIKENISPNFTVVKIDSQSQH